jgi:hypothetical protein
MGNNVKRYRKISVQIWGDEKVRRLSNDGKLAFIFVLTHPNMTSLGAMRGTISGLATELKVSIKAFQEAFREGLLEACEEASLIIAPNFLWHNAPESPNVIRSWGTIADSIPECSLQRKHFQMVKAFVEGLGEAFQEAFTDTFGKALPNPEHEHEHEHEQNVTTPLPPKGNGTRKPKSQPVYSPAFEAFYASYARHRLGFKPTVFESWNFVNGDSCAADIMACLDAEKKTIDWRKEGGKYITNADKWLLKELWKRPVEDLHPGEAVGDDRIPF